METTICPGRRVCDLCRKEGYRFEFDGGDMGGYGLAGYADDAVVNDICHSCVAKFLDDCFADWVRKQKSDNQIIGGYRRAELAYNDEYDYDGRPDCDRCGDNRGMVGGHQNYIVLPCGKQITLCHSCHWDWEQAADVEGDGEWFMSPEEVATFQWSGVESQDARRDRAQKAQREVRKQQGDKCADCGIAYSPRNSFVPWPPEQPTGFVMVCRPCGLEKEGIKGE